MLTHDCKQFSNITYIPEKWRAVLNCRTCKKALTRYVAEEMMSLINNTIRKQQIFVTNIEETAYITTTEDKTMIRPLLWTKARFVCVASLFKTPQANKNLHFTQIQTFIILALQPCCRPTLNQMSSIVHLCNSITDEPKFPYLNALTEALSIVIQT